VVDPAPPKGYTKRPPLEETTMGSPTKTTKAKRERNKTKRGKKQKKLNAKKGTPTFPIHPNKDKS
jgi:hypothetical protein